MRDEVGGGHAGCQGDAGAVRERARPAVPSLGCG